MPRQNHKPQHKSSQHHPRLPKRRRRTPKKQNSDKLIAATNPVTTLMLQDKASLVKIILEQEETIDRLAKSIKRHAEIETTDSDE